MKGKLGVLWLPKGIIRSMGNRLHPISVLGAGFVSLLIAGKTLHTDPRISNRGSLLGKRGSVRVGSAQLSLVLAIHPSPFLIRGYGFGGIRIDRFNSSRFKLHRLSFRGQSCTAP